MTTAPGHATEILASRVEGRSVYDITGGKIGRVGRMFYPVHVPSRL